MNARDPFHGLSVEENDRQFDIMSRSQILHYYNSGELVLYVDRGLASSFAGNGMPISGFAAVLGYFFPILLIAGITALFFLPLFFGIFLIISAFFSIKLARARLVKEVRELAISDAQWFELLRRKRAIWFTKI